MIRPANLKPQNRHVGFSFTNRSVLCVFFHIRLRWLLAEWDIICCTQCQMHIENKGSYFCCSVAKKIIEEEDEQVKNGWPGCWVFFLCVRVRSNEWLRRYRLWLVLVNYRWWIIGWWCVLGDVVYWTFGVLFFFLRCKRRIKRNE